MSERGEAAANNRTPEQDEIDFLKGELNHFKTSGIIEVAVRNPSVMEYMEHWEGRALKAEARCAELEKALEPFAGQCRYISKDWGDDAIIGEENIFVKVGAFRLARATLHQGQDNG